MLNFFDPSFKEFSAPILIKIYYGLSVGLLALGWLVLLLAGFGNHFVTGVIVLILGPISGFFLLIGTRIVCEWVLATIQVAENTQRLVDLMGGMTTPLSVPGASQTMFGNGPVQRFMSAPRQPPAP